MRQKLKRTDNLLVYYAGHSNFDKETQRGYWLPITAERSNKANWITNEDITSELKAIQAKHVLIIADSSYSGTLTRGADVSTGRSGTAEEWVLLPYGRKANTHSTHFRRSGIGIRCRRRRAFRVCQAIFRTLQDNDQIIDMDSLYERIRRWVVLNARQSPIYSDIRFTGHDNG